MRGTLLSIALVALSALTTIDYCAAADPECLYREIRNLPMHWANPTDCGRYFRCTNKNIMREVLCTGNKEYNPNTGKCATAGKGYCRLTYAAPLDEETNDCAHEVDGAYIPERTKCRDFYICLDKLAYPQQCDEGSWFNSTSTNCEPDTKSECWENFCLKQADGTTRPDSGSCLNYYICYNDEATLQKCDSGSYFNVSDGNCQLDENNAKCWENFCLKQADGTTRPDSGSCLNYYICYNDEATLQKCDSGSYFNVSDGNCQLDENNAKCWENFCLKQADGTTRPDSGSCLNYYICYNDEATLQKCDSGSYFNVSDGNCQLDENNAKCWENFCLKQADGTTRPDSGSCLDYYICHNDEATLQKCDSGSYFNVSDGNCQPDENNVKCWENFCLNATDGELVKNPENCHGYYSCQNKIAIPAECDEGSYFDWKLNKCQIGECPGDETPTPTPTPTEDCPQPTPPIPCESCTCPGGYKQGQLMPYPGNCMYYYICTGSALVRKSCYDGNYFNETLGMCTRDIEGVCPQCSRRSRRARRSPEETKLETRNQLQSKAQSSCLDRFFDGEIIPHVQCNKYQVCSEGKLQTYDCEIGNYFNRESKACMTDEANLCSSPFKSIETVFSCMDRYFEGEIISHHDCNKFMICSDGQLHIQECGVKSYFNQQLQACVHDEHNICKVQSISVQRADDQSDCVDKQPGDCTCPGGYDPGDILPHPSECNKYYICQNGQLAIRDCGKGNMFNKTIGVCMPDTENKCKPADDSDCESNVCDGEENGSLVPNKNNCNSFYQCLNGEPQSHTCEADEWFDPAKKSCEVDVNAVCINPCLGSTGIQLLPHPDCSKYYLCNNGGAYVRECIKGGFDPDLGVCTTDAKCESNLCRNKPDGTTLEYDEDKTKFYVCLSNVAVLNRCLEDSAFDSRIGVCLPIPSTNCNQALCQTDANLGAFPTLNGLEDSFCTCRDGEAFEMHCTANYSFNPIIGICLSNAPCDPELCLDSPEYTVSVNQNDTQSFCLCVSKVPVIVKCPKNGTFYQNIMECRPERTQDPNCDPTFCLDKPDYTTGPALSGNDGFCSCKDGGSKYHPCLDDYRFNIEVGVCVPSTPEYSCNITKCADGITTIFPTLNDDYSFCYCESSTHVVVRNCPSGYKFSSSQLACLPEFCDSKHCLNSANQNHPFPAIDYPYGFCMCNGTTADLYECDEGSMFNPNTLVCTSEVNVECDISLCRVEGKPYPYDTSARNDPYSFCYCLNHSTVELFHCPVGKIYNIQYGACLDEETPSPPTNCEDKCTCPGGYPAGAILPHPQNCNQYYICSKGVLKLSNCAVGNYFSASQSVCLVDEERKCTEQSSTPTTCVGAYHENEVIANPSNLRMFYRCLNGRLHLETCDAGYYFNAERAVCIPELMSNWNYKPRSLRSSVSDDDDEFISANDTEENAVNTEDHQCENTTKRSVPSNCSQYEICLNEQWRRRTCTHQRYYNPEEQKCLEPRDDMVCGYAKVSGLPACTSDTEEQTLPHKNITQCGQYFRCVRGKWRLKYCGKAKYYSRWLRTCMPTNLKNICEARNVSEITAPPADKFGCHHTAVRVVIGNCRKYLMCLEGEWWYQFCPLGMYFNETMNYCVPNDKGQCDTITESVSSELNDQSCINEGEQRSEALKCDSYLVCTKGKWRLRKCQKNGFYYNSSFGECLEDTHGKCKPQCNEFDKREFPFNCTVFEICQNRTWYRTSCEENFMYDALMEECIPNDGQCSSNGLYRTCRNREVRSLTIKGNCSQFFYCEASNWLIGACLHAHTYSVELKACVPHNPNDPCRPFSVASGGETSLLLNVDDDSHCDRLYDGSFVPHPNDCTRYYVCLNGRAIDELQCPIDSFFDAKVGDCRTNDGSCIQAFRFRDYCKNTMNNESLIPHPNDCRAYYNCSAMNDSVQLAYCSNGQYFDSESNDCRLDDGQCGLKRPQPKCSKPFEPDRRLPHERFCNVFYACVHKIAVPFECPNGYQFNPVLERCLEDVEGQCTNGDWLVNRNETMIYSCGNLTDGTLLPNPADCRQYFNCSNGYTEVNRCADGSYFNSEQLLCIPEDSSICALNGDELNNRTIAPDPLVCEGKRGDFLPDPANCNEFYVCLNGKLKHERCYTDYFFNTATNQCQSYESLKNETTTTMEGEGDDTANSTLSSLMLTTKMTNETPTINIAQTSQQCMDKPTNFSDLCIAAQIPEGGSIALQGDCRRYISCQDNVPIAQRCRNGESYDSLFGFCRQNDGTCLLENGQRVGECNGRHGQLTRNADNCRGYFICINGQKIPSECEENEYFDKTLNSCQHDTQMQCNSSPNKVMDGQQSDVSCNGLSEVVLYPYTHDRCRSYFQCVNGTLKIHECADGLYFDSTSNRCVKEIQECVMPSTTTTQMPNNFVRAPGVSSDDKPEHRCEAAVIGNPYANIDDHCRSYFICTSIETIVFLACPKGTLYSTERRACAAANYVVC